MARKAWGLVLIICIAAFLCAIITLAPANNDSRSYNYQGSGYVAYDGEEPTYESAEDREAAGADGWENEYDPEYEWDLEYDSYESEDDIDYEEYEDGD